MDRQSIVARLSRGLKHERLAYKIAGIVFMCLAIFFIVIGLISTVFAGAIIDTAYTTESGAAVATGVGVAFVSGLYLGLGAALLPISIVNLVMASKLNKYRLDEALTIKQSSSVGSIVVAAIFNEVALVFVIINFVLAKKNRAILNA